MWQRCWVSHPGRSTNYVAAFVMEPDSGDLDRCWIWQAFSWKTRKDGAEGGGGPVSIGGGRGYDATRESAQCLADARLVANGIDLEGSATEQDIAALLAAVEALPR